MGIASVDPRTGETIETFTALDESQIEARLDAAERAFRSWRKTGFDARARVLEAAAGILESDKASLARTMTEEMGKTLASAVAEVEKCARVCRHYAEHAERDLADGPLATEATTYVRYRPLGPVLAVMPWNFPLWQVFRFAAPALMAGNVGLLKHASNVPRCALAIESVLSRAGAPDGVFATLLIGSTQVSRVLSDPRVVAATLTGSEGAGSAVAARAGELIKPTVLELGGNDAFIVMPSADLDAALDAAVASRTLNNGQSCINAKRFIVHRDVYDAFEAGIVERFRKLVVGDPMESGTQIGPLALDSVRRDVVHQVERSVRMGARLLVGGEAFGERGYWFSPAVLASLPKDAPALREEVFGPVASLVRVHDAEDAVRIANDSDLGLASSVWTNDEREQRTFIDDIEAGQTFVNAMVASDPRVPFGGIKKSGYGRELGALGIRAFTNAKTVWSAPRPAQRASSSGTE